MNPNPIYDLFLKHPAEEGMTYLQHMRRAFTLCGRMFYGGVCLLVHGLVPAWYEREGSHVIRELYQDTAKNKD